MAGMLVPDYEGTAPSQVLGAHFSACPQPLRTLVEDLIDGRPVTVPAAYDVIEIGTSPLGARLAIVDTCDPSGQPCPDSEHAFVLTIAPLRPAERSAYKQLCSLGPSPTLLTDVRNGSAWQLYDCYLLEFTAWPRSMVYASDLPDL